MPAYRQRPKIEIFVMCGGRSRTIPKIIHKRCGRNVNFTKLQTKMVFRGGRGNILTFLTKKVMRENLIFTLIMYKCISLNSVYFEK